jgi:hypothetical protein
MHLCYFNKIGEFSPTEWTIIIVKFKHTEYAGFAKRMGANCRL